MKACSSFNSLIVEVAAGAAGEGDRLRLEDHMATCDGCAAEFARLTGVIAMAKPRHDDPGDVYWDGYYGRLMDRLDGEVSPVRKPVLSGRAVLDRISEKLQAPRWALQLAAAALLVVTGVVLGRTMFSPDAETPYVSGIQTEDATVRKAALETRAHAYLDRSKTLLLGLVNFDLEEDDPASLNVERRRQMAGDLVTEAGLLQSELTANDQQRLSALISDLEIILLQIANIESAYDVPEIEMVQSGVDRKAILFKIEVEEMRRFDDAMPHERPADASPSI